MGRPWPDGASWPWLADRPEVSRRDVARLMLAADADELAGEHLHVCERMVISPCAGVFEPMAAPLRLGGPGSPVKVGAIVGRVSGCEVRSAFSGQVVAMLALPGERVRFGQPVAWLRTG